MRIGSPATIAASSRPRTIHGAPRDHRRRSMVRAGIVRTLEMPRPTSVAAIIGAAHGQGWSVPRSSERDRPARIRAALAAASGRGHGRGDPTADSPRPLRRLPAAAEGLVERDEAHNERTFALHPLVLGGVEGALVVE